MLRHFMTEAYIADSLPGFDANRTDRTLVGPGDYSDDSTPAIAYDAPIRFIYEALIRAFPHDPTPVAEMKWVAITEDGPASLEDNKLRVSAATDTFTRDKGDFVKEGFKVGHKVKVSGFSEAANNGTFFVTAVTDKVL